MPVSTPQRRTAFHPIGRLRANPLHAGRKGGLVSLNLTAMVDMLTVIVIFLLQSFSANGEIMFIQKEVTMPLAEKAEQLTERGPVITLFDDVIMLEGKEVARSGDLDLAELGIPIISEQLKGIREREEQVMARAGKPRDPTKPFEQSVVIQADQDVDFMVVRKAIYSLNEAGWAKVKFTTRAAASSEPAEGGGH